MRVVERCKGGKCRGDNWVGDKWAGCDLFYGSSAVVASTDAERDVPVSLCASAGNAPHNLHTTSATASYYYEPHYHYH